MSRRVLITGGTRGIGRAIATAFRDKGYTVAVTYVGNDEAARVFEREVSVRSFKWDVSDFAACEQNMSLVEHYLGGSIEILVNNAGIIRDGMLHKQDFENWYSVIHTNLLSVFNMSRCVIESMRDAKWGRIINMSSVNAHGMLGQTNYAAAKAGVEGFTKSLALESARLGITVNAIAPGYTNTDMVANVPSEILTQILSKVPINRLATVQEIAAMALFLGGEDAAFITGAVIPVNGGLYM